jgi:hypothetical protein
MKNTILVLLLFTVLVLTLACSHQKQRKKITSVPAQDQYWNSMAEDSLENGSSIITVLDENYPQLSAQIKKEATDPYLPMYWGESLNFDSNAKKQIVDERIISDLQDLFNIKNDNKIVHAGVMHVYGYLFSTIDTPYGYKRKRWIAPTLNRGFDLKSKALSPDTTEGGLFSNVTYFAGMLAFKNKTELSLLKNVSNEIFTFDYSKLKFERVEENLKDYTLVTTLVRFPNKTGDENEYLLIYSTLNKLLNKEQLVTVFPINAESYRGITAHDSLGKNKKIVVRYNAYLAGVEQNLTGNRLLIKH